MLIHISHVFAKSFFIAIYRVSESRRERAAVTLFLSVSLERNTLPLTGAWGGWVVGGLGGGWLAGWLVAGYGSLVSIYIYISCDAGLTAAMATLGPRWWP